jgi:hypothetical protein
MGLTIIAREHIFREIDSERDRQDRLHPGTSRIPDGTGAGRWHAFELDARFEYERAKAEGRLTHAHVLAEEFAEVMAEKDPVALRKELVEVAACCVKWCEEIDRRGRDET